MINDAVVYLEEHEPTIAAYDATEPKDPNYWGDVELAGLKQHVKQHYIAEQVQRCCYCNKQYPTNNGRVWDTEHVQPRSLSPQFMFTPENLAAACVDCNSAKSNAPILDRNNRVAYTRNPRFYKIVHPHFDRYDEHILFLGDKYYTALSDKGAYTIHTCRLFRFAGDGTLPVQLENRHIQTMVGKVFGGTEAEAFDAIRDANVLIDAAQQNPEG